MNDARSFGTAVAKRVHVSHHVVPQALLFLSCHLEVNVAQVCNFLFCGSEHFEMCMSFRGHS